MPSKDSFEQLKSCFENRDWQKLLKLCKKLHYNDQDDIVALYGMLISYTVTGDTEKAKQIIENDIEKFNPLNLKKLKDNNEGIMMGHPDIKEINNILLAREIAKNIKKERMVSFIDDFFNATLPVAIRLFQIKEEKKDNNLQINYFVKTEQRKAELSRLGIDAQLLPYNQNEISEDLALKLLKSKIVVIETYQLMLPFRGLLNALISGSIRFQLWHGLPVKKIGVTTNCDEKVKKDISLMLSIFEDSVKTDYIVTQTDNKNINDAYLSAFPNAKLVPTGDTRIDVLFDETLSIGEEYISSLKRWSLENKNKKKILLMFTFRDFVEEDAKHLIEINSLIDTLIKSGFVIGYKPHHESFIMNPEIHNKLCKKVLLSGGFCFGPDQQSYLIFKYFDTLITDYSSVRFNFIVTGKPVILYRKVDLYRAEKGDFWTEMDKAFYNLTSLEDVKNIKDWIDNDPLKEERMRVYNIVHKYSDGKSSLKTAEYIYNLLQNS